MGSGSEVGVVVGGAVDELVGVGVVGGSSSPTQSAKLGDWARLKSRGNRSASEWMAKVLSSSAGLSTGLELQARATVCSVAGSSLSGKEPRSSHVEQPRQNVVATQWVSLT